MDKINFNVANNDIELAIMAREPSKWLKGHHDVMISVTTKVTHPLTKKTRSFLDFVIYAPEGTYGQQRYRCWLKIQRLMYKLGATPATIKDVSAQFWY